MPESGNGGTVSGPMKGTALRRVRVIDSHTGGEPTRLVTAGGPDLGTGPLSERLEAFRSKHDSFRSAVVSRWIARARLE